MMPDDPLASVTEELSRVQTSCALRSAAARDCVLGMVNPFYVRFLRLRREVRLLKLRERFLEFLRKFEAVRAV